MAITISNEVRKAALDGICALFNSGSFRVLTSGDAELAAPTFQSTAFGAASAAAISVATANTLVADTSITAGTYTKWEMRTSAPALRLSGSIGTGTEDIQVTDNTIGASATSWSIGGLTLSLSLS